MNGIASYAGLAVFSTAVLGMLVGAVLATTGAVTRRRHMLAVGARLGLNGPGLASLGMGLYLTGLPWPATLIALLPLSFGALLLWVTTRAVIRS